MTTEDTETETRHQEGDREQEEEEEEESWYGWLVVAASFLCNMVIDGMGYSFGVMLQPLMAEFQVGAGQVSFVGSLLNGVVMLSAPAAAASINRLGPRVTCVAGSLVSSLAILLSSYATSLAALLLSYGVLGGVGLGLMYAPAVVTVGQYFSRRLNLATGISVCGSGAGTFLFAPVASGLIARFGWRGCNRVMAAFCLLCSLLGLVMAPNTRTRRGSRSRQNEENKSRKLIDVSILKDAPFLLYIASNVPTVMAVYSVYSYIPAMGESAGLLPEQASFLISMIGITNTVGRVAIGWLSDIPCVSPLVVNLVSLLISVMFPLLISLPRPGYSALLALAALLGVSIAPLPTVTSGVITALLGPDKLNDAFGVLTFVRGGSAFLGPPLAGYLADYHHDFSMPFILASVLWGSAFFICSGAWVVLRRRARSRHEYHQL